METTDRKVTGAYSKAGNGYCLECATDLSEEDFARWDTTGEIVCDNCGKDTGIDIDPKVYDVQIPKTLWKKLKEPDVVELNRKVEIYIPSKIGEETIGQSTIRWITETVAARFNEAFGGCTITDGYGSYTHENGAIVTERVTIVAAFATDAAFEDYTLRRLQNLALFVGENLHQESVLYTVDGKGRLLFV